MRGQTLLSTKMRGQTSIMEYLLMSFFMLLVIFVLIFFLFWWQATQLNMEQNTIKIEQTDVLMNRITSSPIFVSEDSVLDDSKLMALMSLGRETCNDMERLFGERWFIEVEAINTRPGCAGECDASSYPCCGYWEICPPESEPVEVSMRVLPVNVYRKAEDRTDLAVIRVGVYR